MPAEQTLPPELTVAALALEKQIKRMGVTSQNTGLAEWDVLTPKVRSMVPGWVMELLANHPLNNVLLERPHELDYAWGRQFRFFTPQLFAQFITPDDPVASRTNGWWLTEEFIRDGFIPISHESDGDVWIISRSAGPSSPVYLYSLTAGERIVAAETMAVFLAHCKVSEEQD